ncbi:MAG: hypothetical protein QM719_07405 [Thermomonas sp.]
MLKSALLTLALAFMLAAAPTSSDGKTYEFSGAGSCQLSIPTTRTMVRARANGYRNEGSTDQFVICGLDGYEAGTFISYSLIFTSSDGQPHDISCTAAGGLTGAAGPFYSSKTVTIPATSYTYLTWTAPDFGEPAGSPISYNRSFNASVTCSLPPKAAIQSFETVNND